MRKIYLLLIVLCASLTISHAQCTLTNATSCVCKAGGTNCDLLPDVKAAKPPLTIYGSSQGVIEYSQSGNGANDGRLRISVATPNIGHGPLHVVADSAYVCGTDTLYANPVPTTCPDGITATRLLVKQKIYHKNGNVMSSYNRPAGSMTYHASHGHMHVDNWGVFTLRTATTDPNPLNWPIVGNGAKLAFCLMDFGSCATYNGHCEDDNGNVLTTTPNVGLGGGNFSCSSTSQGITAGYEDIYYQHLDGMWINIPPGTCNGNYYIVAQLDPYNNFLEENDNNNVTAVPVTLTKQGGVVPTITASGATTFCTGGSVTLTATAATNYLWSNGATTQSIVVNTSGSYSCTINTASACSATSTATTVTVNNLPVTANASSTNICAGTPVTLSSTAANGGTIQVPVNFSNNTVYSIPDNNTTGVNSNITVSGINPATIGANTVVSATVNIIHTYDGDIELRLYAPNGAYQLLSNRRGGSADNYTNTVFTMSAVNLVTAGAAPFTGSFKPEGNFASFTGNVNGTWQLRVIDRDPNDTGTIQNWTLSINNTVPTTVSYAWSSNPAGFNASTQNTSASPMQTTTYMVTATESGTGCVGTNSVTVNTSNPTVTLSGVAAICAGQSTTLSASGATTYAWSPSTGLSATTGASVTANPTSTQTYTVVGTTNGCTDTKQITLNVNALPAVSVSPSGTISSCVPVTLSATTSATSIEWKLNGGAISGANAPSYQATASGNYSVLVQNANGCSSESGIVQLTIGSSTPSITANGPTSICAGSGSVVLSAPAGGSYQWYRNNVLIQGVNSQNYTASSNGMYYCFVTIGACAATSNGITVTVLNNPNPTISNNSALNFCAGGSVNLVANTFAGVTYQWQKNGTDIIGATSQNYSANTTGYFRVKQTANGCAKFSGAIGVNANGSTLSATIMANGGTNFCTGGSVALLVSNVIPGYTYQWKNNGANINGANSTSYTASASGNYSCAITASCGTAVSNAITIVVGTIDAVISPAGVVTVCNGASVALSSNTGTGFQYQWKLNGTNISGATNSSYNAVASGSYTVEITSPCGVATSLATTINNTALTATLSPAGTVTICAGSATVFTANTGSNIAYQWYRNGVAVAGATSSTHATSSYGNYYVVLSQGGVCTTTSNTTVLAVTNNPNAIVSPSGNISICAGQTATLTANTFAGVSYVWQKNGTDISGATNQTLAVSSSGSYRVKQSANNCTKSSPSTVVAVNCRIGNNGEVLPMGSDNEVSVVPNPFNISTQVILSNSADLKTTQITIYDTMGKTVKHISSVADYNVMIEKGNMAAGIYMLYVTDAVNAPSLKRIVVE
jgi:subtilisin-like proprotein convertase family protein